MSRPVLSSATRRLQQSTTHCQRAFSTTRFSSALSEPIIRSSSNYTSNASSLHVSARPRQYTLRKVNISSFRVPRNRAFSSSTVRPSAKVVQNARNDEEGKPLMVGISERAAEVRYSLLPGIPLSTYHGSGWRGMAVRECGTVAKCGGIPDRSRTSFEEQRKEHIVWYNPTLLQPQTGVKHDPTLSHYQTTRQPKTSIAFISPQAQAERS